jgi:ankyrin repeat protein
MEDLVRRGASINESGALQSAVANKESMMVKILLRLGGDVNHRDELGTTPLHVAAGCQRYKDTKLLNIC